MKPLNFYFIRHLLFAIKIVFVSASCSNDDIKSDTLMKHNHGITITINPQSVQDNLIGKRIDFEGKTY